MLIFSNINKHDQPILEQLYKLLSKQEKEIGQLKIEVVYCHKSQMQSYKKQYYGMDEDTDVLTFDWREDASSLELLHQDGTSQDMCQAQILINIDLAKDSALAFGISLLSEKAVLFIHGLLHLIYGDHNSPNKKDLFETTTRDIIKLMNLEYRSIWPKEKK
jgi:rRNA maturation RNase YbeY